MTQDSRESASAPVSDSPETDLSPRPDPNVDLACRLMWCYFGLTVLTIPLELLRASDLAVVIGIIVGGLIGCFIAGALTLWATTKLRAGRNWMRLLVTTVIALNVLLIPITWDWYRPYFLKQLATPIDATITVAQWLLSFAAVFLVNTRSARLWFGTMKRESAHVA
jgi:hypothetical protein